MEDVLKLSDAKAIRTSFCWFIFNEWWTDGNAKLLNTPCQTPLSTGDDTTVSFAVTKYKYANMAILCLYFILSLCREDLDAEQKMFPEHLLITDSNRAYHSSSKVGSSPNDPAGDQPVTDLIHTIHSSILTNQRGLPLTPHQSKATVFECL